MRKVFLRRMIKGMTVVCIILGWFSLALSAEIKLAWDANIESDLAGYNVYYGTLSPPMIPPAMRAVRRTR
jgi:hypothetical protein